jgi:2-polyprenyl-3-methyl-5-hydroxy-6-metoxy-1,4-benzoquinol methylase
MNIDHQHDVTLKTYGKIAYKWNEINPDGHHHDVVLKKFQELLPNGHVLEIGCAAGRDSDKLAKLGYKYTGTDAVQEFIDQASNQYPKRTFITCKAQDIQDVFKEASFDGFWCSATLLHIPRGDIISTLQGIRKAIKNGAIGMISLQKGTGENFEQNSKKTDGSARLFVYYTKETFAEVLLKAGFKIMFYEEIPRAERPDWLHFIVRAID